MSEEPKSDPESKQDFDPHPPSNQQTPKSSGLSNNAKWVIGIVAVIASILFFNQIQASQRQANARAMLEQLSSALTDNNSSLGQNSSVAAPTPSPTESAITWNKSFALDSIKFSTDADGYSHAIGRVRNIADRTKTALFTITILKSDGQSPDFTFMGSAENVAPQEQVTVEFVTSAGVLNKDFTYQFQVDSEMG